MSDEPIKIEVEELPDDPVSTEAELEDLREKCAEQEETIKDLTEENEMYAELIEKVRPILEGLLDDLKSL